VLRAINDLNFLCGFKKYYTVKLKHKSTQIHKSTHLAKDDLICLAEIGGVNRARFFGIEKF